MVWAGINKNEAWLKFVKDKRTVMFSLSEDGETAAFEEIANKPSYKAFNVL